MRKLISVVCAGLLIFSLAGCSNQNIDVQTNAENRTEAKDSSFQLSVIREVIEMSSKNTKIHYPKLQGYAGELSMDYMNQSIKQIADFYAISEDYSDVQLDYEVKRLDEELVSILFKGTGKYKSLSEINIQKSINLDVKSTNPIEYANFIKDDEKARQILDIKAKNNGIVNGFEAEGVFLYFQGDNVVFYYMPLDDSAKGWVELSVPLSELEGFVNVEFGEHPAS